MSTSSSVSSPPCAQTKGCHTILTMHTWHFNPCIPHPLFPVLPAHMLRSATTKSAQDTEPFVTPCDPVLGCHT
eukprot:1136213-Pelagomonas_calceolata.AAC.2